jgi:peroxiredoxin family protein/rhodanese-related sulfurtransferase/TusA-related sulfurtransferase
VNFLGMVAANALRGDSRPVHRGELPAGALLLDVREPAERELGTIPGSAFIPLGELRSRLQELPRDRQIVVFCKVGLRGYIAERILRQNGFDACNLSGGITTWKLAGTDAAGGTPAAALPPAAPAPAPSPAPSAAPAVPKPPDSASTAPPAANPSVDVSCLQCPGPLVRVRQEVEALPPGGVLAVHAAATFRADLEAWCRCTGHQLLQAHQVGDTLDAVVRKVADSATTPAVAAPAAAVPAAARPDSAAIVVFSNDLDKVLAAFIIATGLASLGGKVTLFFTFWGLNVLRRDAPPLLAKDFLSRMFGLMMPRGARRLALSKLHMLGMGTAMMKHVMAQKRVPSLPDLITQAHALGVRFVACDMAMNVMGLRREELIDSVDEIVGVASFAALARDSQTVLFI